MPERYGEKPKGFKKRLGYIWDYYKIHMVAVLLVAALVLITVYNFAARTNPDYVVIVAFSRFVSDEHLEPLREFLQEHGVDVNDDGEVLVEIINVSYNRYVLQAEQGTAADEQIRQGARVRLMGELQRNRAMIFITDDSYFEHLQTELNGEIFANISSIVYGASQTQTFSVRVPSYEIPNFNHLTIPQNINFSIRNSTSDRWQPSYDLLETIFGD